jgi:hypothetical protein
VYTATRVAQILDISEALLDRIAETIEPGKDGVLSIWHTTDESICGFTEQGLDYAREILIDPSRMAHILKDFTQIIRSRHRTITMRTR